MNKKQLKKLLNEEVEKRDSSHEVTKDKPDPLLVVHQHKEEYIALLCSMFAYGRASMIVRFLESLDFSYLDKTEADIQQNLKAFYYRLQSTEDVKQIFITLRRLKKQGSLEDIFYQYYEKKHEVMDGIQGIIDTLYALNPYRSRGYNFLIGPEKIKLKGGSAYKRWHLFLRWMVRKDKLDLGLWTSVEKKDLIIPLDTHLHRLGLQLGLLKRKQADLTAALELTQSLKTFDSEDPVKYDMAIYRMGQEQQL